MNFNKSALATAALCVAVGTMSASAQNVRDDEQGCRIVERQVKEAFDANAQSPNFSAASDERHIGRDGCRQGYYKFGISHYKRALEILAGN